MQPLLCQDKDTLRIGDGDVDDIFAGISLESGDRWILGCYEGGQDEHSGTRKEG